VRMDDEAALEGALRVLRQQGSLLVLPTETLYGFSARASDARSIERVQRLKGRGDRGFVAIAADLPMVQRYLPEKTSVELIGWLAEVWPAALSVILSVNQTLHWGRGSVDSGATAAFRVPTHPWLRELAGKLGEPILSTSVNRSGAPPHVRCADIATEFGAQVDYLIEDPGLEAATTERRASTLVDATQWPPLLLRQGAFPLEIPTQGNP
jgi:L-threonylcarbamoyladenylate synthase